MMNTYGFVASLASAMALAGCVVMPTAPMIAALPGSQKGVDQFRIDDGACRDYAQAAVSAPAQAAASNVAANTAVGTAIGATAGAIIGSASGRAGEGAAVGAGAGLVVGSTAGSSYAGASSYQLQRQYDMAYLQCMYARGNRVPAPFVYQTYRSRDVAPSYPPPDYPPPSSAPSAGPPAGSPPLTYPPRAAPPPR